MTGLLIPLLRTTDRAFGAVIAPLYDLLAKPSKLPKKPQKIVLVKLWAVGESILTLPLLKALRKRYPDARIDVLATSRNADVYTGLEEVDAVHTISLWAFWTQKAFWKQRNSYDIALDCEPYLNLSAVLARILATTVLGFSHGARAQFYDETVPYNDEQHVVRTYLDLGAPLGIKYDPRTLPRLAYSEEDEQYIKQLLHIHRVGRPLIGVGAGTAESAPSREWSTLKWAHLIDRLIEEHGAHVVLVGTERNRSVTKKITRQTKRKNRVHDFAGQTTLKQFFALADACDVFVSVDSGAMHVAAATRTPTIGLFGPETPVRFSPFGPENASVYKPVRPEPCINVHKGEVPRCKDHRHLRKIKVSDVYQEVRERL